MPAEEGMRMRDLVKLSGLPRETIHFYLIQGLLPKAIKTGRNTALYGDEHLDRLHRIKELQDRHFLPLRAIKAVLEESTGAGFSEQQDAMLQRVRSSLSPSRSASRGGRVLLSTLVPSRISRVDLDAMKRSGFVEVEGRGAGSSVSEYDALILGCWAELRGLMKKGEPPLTPDLLTSYDDAMEALVARETRMLAQHFAGLSGDRAVELIEATEPLVARMLDVLRRKKIQALLDNVPPPTDPTRD